MTQQQQQLKPKTGQQQLLQPTNTRCFCRGEIVYPNPSSQYSSHAYACKPAACNFGCSFFNVSQGQGERFVLGQVQQHVEWSEIRAFGLRHTAHAAANIGRPRTALLSMLSAVVPCRRVNLHSRSRRSQAGATSCCWTAGLVSATALSVPSAKRQCMQQQAADGDARIQ